MKSSIKNLFLDWNFIVIDDEPDSLEVATRWLKIAGAHILTAENGRAGLELVHIAKPHVIITDLTMPVMDGWELLYELKQNPETASIPVIALTAHAMQSTKDRTAEVGFVGHISKPLDPFRFVDHVLAIVKNTPQLTSQLAKPLM